MVHDAGRDAAPKTDPILVLDFLTPGLTLDQVGGKAWSLARAGRAGFPTPPGIVVTATSARADVAALAASLDDALARLGEGPFAVRSSAIAEDGSSRSFAGQLETELGVSRTGVAAAIARCWASADAVRTLRYGGGAGGVAVLVQPLVKATAAGVAFSVDPQSGERGVVVIEAVRGLGDQLVSGAATPDAWRVDREGASRQRPEGPSVLTRDQVDRVAALARAMESLFEAPQDIEWAFDGDELVLLQSRPVTALPAAPVPIPVEVPPGSWDRDDHHAVLSPLGWAWFRSFPDAMSRVMRDLGLPIQRVEAARIGGYLYLRMAAGRKARFIPPPWVLWAAARLLPSLRSAERRARQTLDDESYLDTLALWHNEWRPAIRADIARLFDPDPSPLSDAALLRRIEEVLALTARGLEHHARLVGARLVAIGRFGVFVKDRLGWDDERILTLLHGSSASTTELHRSLEALVARHLPEVEAAGGLPSSWGGVVARLPELGRELTDWLHDNQLRMLHYDPKHPTLGERPDYVLSIVDGAYHALRNGEGGAAGATGPDGVRRAREGLGADDFREFERRLDHARRLHAARDENGVDTMSRPVGLLRHYVLELGRRLPLAEPEHAIYLTPDEHGPALRGAVADLQARIDRRRGEETWAMRNRGPRRYGPRPGPTPSPEAFPSGLARLFRIFGWISQLGRAPDSTDGSLRGVGLGSRVVTGRARVVHRPEDLAELRHGEIVVCRITSPEWSVGLGRVAAIVTEEGGGGLSHPAIIAREFGVPALLGVEGIMTRIATGDHIRVDPLEGTIVAVNAVSAGA